MPFGFKCILVGRPRGLLTWLDMTSVRTWGEKNSDHFEVAMTSNIVLMYWVVRDGHDHYSRIFTYIEDFWHRSICMSRVLTCLNIPFEHPGRPVDAKVFLGEAGRLRWNMMDLQDHLEQLVERPRRQAAHTRSNMHVQLIHSQKRLLWQNINYYI